MDRTHQGPLYKRKGFAMKENKFQADLKKELKSRFPGCIVTKLDSADIQGIPDLLVLYQDYYVEKMDNMSFSKFIYPENKEEVLDELHQAFES